MKISGLKLRAVLVPLGVAGFLIAALVWYAARYIPTQAQYLNERNSRLLNTIATQVRSKVNNLDLAIDNAIDSFDRDGKDERFGRYVKKFSPDFKELWWSSDRQRSCGRDDAWDLAADPPRMKIELDEGRNYVYLFYKRDLKPEPTTACVTATVDIEHIVAPYLASRAEFDAVAVVSGDGRVITQYSQTGVQLTDVARLTAPAPPQKSSSEARATSSSSSFSEQTGAPTPGAPRPLPIGSVTYQAYQQPVQLSLLSEDTKSRAGEKWTVVGLVRLDRVRAESSAISSIYWLMLIGAVAVLSLSIPLIKLYALATRERFSAADSVLVAGTSFLIAGLVAFVVLDCSVYVWTWKTVDARLRMLSHEMASAMGDEAVAASKQLDAVDAERSHELDQEASAASEPVRVGITDDDRFECKPEWACAVAPVSTDRSQTGYPYFDLIAWNDSDGEQRVKLRTTIGITPFLNIREAGVAFYPDLERARSFGDEFQRGVSVVRSPNTGEPLTVFWKARPGMRALTSVTLATNPISLVRPVLPADVQFAVVDAAGHVMYHSDPGRSLNEDFFQECEGAAALVALVRGRRSGSASAHYLGNPQRFFVQPLELKKTAEAFADPEWSLVVFERTLAAETTNLETLTLALALFAFYGIAVAVTWAIAYRIWPQHLAKWFWPDPAKAAQYRRSAILSGFASLLTVTLVAITRVPWMLEWTAVVAVGALMAVFAIVRFSNVSARGHRSWAAEFLSARVAALFVVAALPAIACFAVAYTFENTLSIRRQQLRLAAELDQRRARVEAGTAKLALCEPAAPPCPAVAKYRDQRLKVPWDVHIVPFTIRADRPMPEPNEAGLLDRLLSAIHLPYNDVAVELQSVASSQPLAPDGTREWSWSVDAANAIVLTKGELTLVSAPSSRFAAWLWLTSSSVVIAIALFLLLRFVARCQFMLDLHSDRGIRSSGARKQRSNVLLLGPPGSGKTEVLRSDPTRMVLDVRSVADVGSPHPASEPAAAGAAAHGSLGTPRPDVLDGSKLPERGLLGIDHLEYRIEDPAFCGRFLPFLEELLFQKQWTVWIASTRDPIDQLQEAQNDAKPDLNRWRRLMESFRLEAVGFDPKPRTRVATSAMHDKMTAIYGQSAGDVERLVLNEFGAAPQLLSLADDVIAQVPVGVTPAAEDLAIEIAAAAEPFYQALWAGCSRDQRLALRQLAEEGVVNPRNSVVMAQLLRSGLVRRDPTFRMMNETFRRFVLDEVSAAEIASWERDNTGSWRTITTTMLSGALALVGVVLLNQQQMVDSWVGSFAPALVPAIPLLAKVVTFAQRDTTAADPKPAVNA